MRAMNIRVANFNDLGALARLEQYFPSDRISRSSFRRLIHKGHAEIWVCDIDGELIDRKGGQIMRDLWTTVADYLEKVQEGLAAA